MSTSGDPLTPQRLRTMQIIAAALLLGVLIFLSIILYMVLVQNQGAPWQPPQDVPMLSIIAAVMLVLNAPLALLLPRLQTQAALKQIAAGRWRPPVPTRPGELDTDADKLLAIKQMTLTVSLALLEGAAFCAIFGYLLEGSYLALAVVGMAVLVMLALFPTEGRIRAWLDHHLQRLADLRHEQSGAAT